MSDVNVNNGVINFIYPFDYCINYEYWESEKIAVINLLADDQWKLWNELNDEATNQLISKYFMPNLEPIIFPNSDSNNLFAFHRYAKHFNKKYIYILDNVEISFKLEQINIILNGYGLGFIYFNIIPETDVTDEYLLLMDTLRQLEQHYPAQRLGTIKDENNLYSVKEWLRSLLSEEISKKIFTNTINKYFYNDRMFVQYYVSLYTKKEMPENEKKEYIYKFLNVDGTFFSAKNMKFIDKIINEHVYDRWAPETYTNIIEYSSGIVNFTNTMEYSFFTDKILPQQIKGVYLYLYLFLLNQIIYLEKLYYHLSSIKYKEYNNEEFQKLKELSISYLQNYDKSKLTSQLQGLELHRQWSSILGIETLKNKFFENLNIINNFT